MAGSWPTIVFLDIDLTCRDEDIPERPDQIRAWLRANRQADQRYLVLDDGDYGWGELVVHLTDGATGLTDLDADLAIDILNGGDS